MWRFVFVAWVIMAFVTSGSAQEVAGVGRVAIIDSGDFVPLDMNEIPVLGPQIGQILDAHYYPGIKFYQAGQFSQSYAQLKYFVDRASYVNGNSNQAQYLTSAYYLRGMIFLYHASGVGQFTLAQREFQAALKWNPKNYLARLELARVYAKVDLKDEAIAVLKHLLQINPDKSVVEEAQKELQKLTANEPQ